VLRDRLPGQREVVLHRAKAKEPDFTPDYLDLMTRWLTERFGPRPWNPTTVSPAPLHRYQPRCSALILMGYGYAVPDTGGAQHLPGDHTACPFFRVRHSILVGEGAGQPEHVVELHLGERRRLAERRKRSRLGWNDLTEPAALVRAA
jgi:hypothetical protein